MPLKRPYGWGIFIAFTVVFVIYMILETYFDTSATEVPRELTALALGGLFLAGVGWIIWRLGFAPKSVGPSAGGPPASPYTQPVVGHPIRYRPVGVPSPNVYPDAPFNPAPPGPPPTPLGPPSTPLGPPPGYNPSVGWSGAQSI